MLTRLFAAGFLFAAFACVPKSQYVKATTDLSNTQELLRGIQLEVERQTRQNQEIAGELDLAKKQIALLQAALTQLEAKTNQDIADLEKEVARAKKGTAEADALSRDLAQAKQKREADVALLQQQLAEAREEARKQAERLAKMNATYANLVTGLQQEIDAGKVTITNLKGKLTVNLIDKILFDSGRAELNAEGKGVLDKVSSVLATVRDRRISVEGHTDDVPIARAALERFPSNWELSTARASTVVRYLVEQGVPPERLAAAGFSKYQALVPNDSDENRRLNRRIEIVLEPELLPEENRAAQAPATAP